MEMTGAIRYAGVNDRCLDLFEGQFCVPDGMAYNSYVLLDEKIAVMDAVETRFADDWLKRIARATNGKAPDYLVVQHMEPDHSGSLGAFVEAYPQAKIVASAKAFAMMKNFFNVDLSEKAISVGEGDRLPLGSRALHFMAAPMVHWPEVIMTYDTQEKIFFSADAFGAFGALDAQVDWIAQTRRYYFGIVGKYGTQVQAVLKKIHALDVRMICPLHGPVLRDNISDYLELYHIWSSYEPEEDGVTIAYASMYGNTGKAAERLAVLLRQKGVEVSLHDLGRCDFSAAAADAFRYSRLVLASPTYNGGLFPAMRAFVEHLTERGYTKRRVALIENGSWAPAAARAMRALLEKCKDLTYTKTAVKIISALHEESAAQLEALAEELCQ